MVRHILFVLGFLLVLQALPVALHHAHAQTMQIAAVVNDDAISMTDVNERMKLVMTSSGFPNTPEVRAKVMPQVINALIEEQLKIQEAARNKLTLTDDDIEKGFGMIAEQNHFSVDQFKDILRKQGIPIKTLEHQIRAQMSWTKVVKQVYRHQVDVTPSDVDTRLARLKSEIGKTEYLVSEIYLPTDDQKHAGEVQQLASRMASELQAKKAPFGPVAAQFSKAAGAQNGGSIGWIQEGQIEPELEKVIVSMDEGQVSDPINMPGGIYILALQKKRTMTEDTLPSRDELTNQIGFERLDRVQQKALLDLKTSAFIDRRV